MTAWERHIAEQKSFCEKHNCDWTFADPQLRIGLADSVLTDLQPINGLRHPITPNATGWYVWSGEEFSDADDFFKPYCVKHLIERRPEILKYLGLPPGHRFLIDNKGYEDVWMDENLLDV